MSFQICRQQARAARASPQPCARQPGPACNGSLEPAARDIEAAGTESQVLTTHTQ
jgi:hypothetical protein